MYSIYRHINDISLNGREYILDADDKLMLFPTHQEAMEYLEQNGITREDIGISVWIEKEKAGEQQSQ